jgi:hypothetical protein
MRIEMSTLAYIAVVLILLFGIFAGVLTLGVVGYIALANPFQKPPIDPNEVVAKEGGTWVDTSAATGAVASGDNGTAAGGQPSNIEENAQPETPIEDQTPPAQPLGCTNPTGLRAETRCDGDTVKKCDGTAWATLQECTGGQECSNGACVSVSSCKFPDADHGGTTCSSKDASHTALQYVWECNNGNWEYVSDCGKASDCVAGKCV